MKLFRWTSLLVLTLAATRVAMADDDAGEASSEPRTEMPTVVDVTPAAIDLVFGVNRCEEAISRSYELNEAIQSGYWPSDFREECDRLFGAGVVDYAGPMSIFGMTPFDPQNFPLERLGAVISVQDPATARTRMGAPDGLLDEATFSGRLMHPTSLCRWRFGSIASISPFRAT